MTTNICTKCNKEFTIPFGEQPYKRCPACRKYSTEHYHKYMNGQTYKSPKRAENDRLLNKIREIEEYNDKYGTHYTYGQYIAARDHGWLKHDWSEFEDGNKSDM